MKVYRHIPTGAKSAGDEERGEIIGRALAKGRSEHPRADVEPYYFNPVSREVMITIRQPDAKHANVFRYNEG